MRKFSIFTIGIVAMLAVMVTSNSAQAGGRYNRGGNGGAVILGMIAGIAIGEIIASKSRKRHKRYRYGPPPVYYQPAPPPVAYYPQPAPRPYYGANVAPRGYFAPPPRYRGDYRPSPYSLRYNPHTANRQYPGSYRQRRPQCHEVHGIQNVRGGYNIVTRRICR
jgi:hypothetical protein